MKILGIIGGVGPESTIDYYRLLIAGYRERRGDGSHPSLLINSLDLKAMVELVSANRLEEFAQHLVRAVAALAQAGADLALIAANTPHIVFDDVRRQSPIPMLSIVEAACDAARAQNLKRLLLLGTGFTMGARFYPIVFSASGISLVVPREDEQAYIHEKYMGELLNGIFLPQTRERLVAIIDRLRREEQVDGVILAGTELPLILREAGDRGVPLLDTTQIHVNAAVEQMFA